MKPHAGIEVTYFVPISLDQFFDVTTAKRVGDFMKRHGGNEWKIESIALKAGDLWQLPTIRLEKIITKKKKKAKK